MSCIVLDINDSSLSLWRDGERVLQSPGYALLDGKNYSFGEAARAQARLQPRQINHRYWSQLSMEPMNPAFGPCRHSADLVHAHLSAIVEQAGRPEEFIIAAPGSLQHDQLALLLGIIEQCPFRATGLIDRAVAAVVDSPAADYTWHVELQLNQALVTGLRYADGAVLRDSVVPIPGSGWLALQESLARAIADAFIRQTRFDPRHEAASEQLLYDQLPELLGKLQQKAEQNIELGGRQARVERSLLAESCDTHYQRILNTVNTGEAPVVLGGMIAELPGIDDRLPGSRRLDAASIYRSIERHAGSISGGAAGLHFITSLPAQAAGAAPAPQPEPAAQPEPEPIATSRCQIDIDGGQLTLRHLEGPAPRVNGESIVASRPLRAGDLIELEDGQAWRLLEAQDD